MTRNRERRGSKRIYLMAPCMCFFDDNDEQSCVLKDISRDGLCVLISDTSGAREIGEIIRFQFLDGPYDSITGSARVVRNKVLDDGSTEIGCRVIKINPLNYIEQLEIKDAVDYYRGKYNRRKGRDFDYE